MNLCDIINTGCDSMDYNKIIQQILQDYKKTFNIDINIVCDTRDKLQTIEPTLVIRGNTAAIYHNRSRTIFINSEVFEKVKNKNYNNSNNQYDNGMSFLIHACFHELEHRLQSDYPQMLINQNSIYPMMYQIEQFLISTYQHEKKYDEYARLHDKFISEIDADIKGNKNLKAFANQYGIPVNPNYIELFNYYNVFRENNYEPLYFINIFNKKIKEYPEALQTYFDQSGIVEFYDNSGNLKSIDEIMRLANNPLLPHILSSLEFNDDKEEKMKQAKEKLEPRFKEFIEYTKISDKTSKSLETQDYSEMYKYLVAVSSSLMQHISTKNKSK